MQGNGVYREESRPVQPFQGIRVEDGIEATVTAGAAQQTVVVSADENVVQYMKTDVVSEPPYGQVLRVWIDMESWSSTNPPRVRVEVPQLRFAAVSGDSHLTASEVSAPALRLEAADKSSLWVSGAGGGSIDVVASDSAVHAEAYAVSTSATVDLSSGAKVWLRSNAPVTGTVRAGCTLDNMLGTGTCSGLTLEGGPTILCNP